MRFLRPLVLKPEYYSHIDKQIQSVFNDLFYIPAARFLTQKNPIEGLYQNSIDILISALLSNRIYYVNGTFYGNFNSHISKEFMRLGAQFNARTKGWKLDTLPPDLGAAIVQVNSRYTRISENILGYLGDLKVDKRIRQADLFDSYEVTLSKMQTAFEETVKNIGIVPTFTPEMKSQIAEEWGDNLEIYIQNWSDENILKLREEISANAFRGQRAENLEKTIMANYGVSQRKAKFLARQETSLLMSKFRQTSYEGIGSKKYRWSGTNDGRERPDHVALNNTIQTWNNPPVVDRKTGRHAHPGEDYGCRCVAVALIE